MKVPESDLMEIYCKAKLPGGQVCGRYLGRVQIGAKNHYTDFKCYARRCRSITQVRFDERGILHVGQTIEKQKFLQAPVSNVFMEA